MLSTFSCGGEDAVRSSVLALQGSAGAFLPPRQEIAGLTGVPWVPGPPMPSLGLLAEGRGCGFAL